MRKVLISACVIGKNVRWSGGNKRYDKIKDWADEHDIKLVPVCPENDLFARLEQRSGFDKKVKKSRAS